jgi:adenylate cyclase
MTSRPKSRLGKFWGELRRRRVIRTVIAYVVVGYVVAEAASVFFPTLMLPEWTVRAIAAIVILGLPIVIVLAWIFDIEPSDNDAPNLSPKGRDASATDGLSVPPLSSAAFASVAVLPFENLSPDEGNQFIADGIATELHGALAKVHRLRVAARTSAFSPSHANVGVKEIARNLNVQFVISGSVRCVSDRLRITVELNNAIEGVQIWTETYDRDIDDIFSVQQDIAYAVASEFGGARLREEVVSAAKYPTENLDAWSLVQRARSYVLQFTPNALERAVPLLRRAIELDSNYAAAHAALASVLAEQVLNGLSSNLHGDTETALRSADRAFSQSPGDPFVLKMCGAVWAYFGHTRKSLDTLRLAVEIAPFDFGAWGYLGWTLAATGEEQSLTELQEIMERILRAAPHHPGVPYWQYHRSVAFVCAGKFEDAVTFARNSVDHNPTFPWGWMHYANALGMIDAVSDAQTALDRCAEFAPSLTTGHYEFMVRQMSQSEAFAERRVAGLRRLTKR